MAQANYEGSYPAGRADQSAASEDISGWAVGITFFASCMLLMVGFFHIIAGLAAVLDDSFYAVRAGYALELDTQTWGWLHMAFGMIAMIAGGLLLTGNLLARILVIAIAVISAIGNFWSIPYYPVWSILMIALDVAIIWAVTAYGRFAHSAEV
jgi:hypothetical protein